MNLIEDHLASLDAGRDHKAHAAFTRLAKEPDAPIHSNDLRPILTWVCDQLGQLGQRVEKLEQRQDANKHNPEPEPGN